MSTLPESAYAALGLSPEVLKILMTPKPKPAELVAPNLHQNENDFVERMAPNESAIMLYAELLLHIRTVTLFASLRTHHSRETHAQLSADGSHITVTHEGHSATISLPLKLEGKGDATLELPAHPPSKELTLRLQMEEREGSELLGMMAEERKANIVPWDGASLNRIDQPKILCKNCEAEVVPEGKIREWKDLPNENWAEMMDFWHCHKPDEHHLHDHTHEATVGQKGYAAGNRLQAAAEIGFVDLTSFLLKEQDCPGAQAASQSCEQARSIVCKHCEHILGFNEEISNGWRIWKWSVSMSTASVSSHSSHTDFTPQKWISARLLYLVENSGVRKFHIRPVSLAAPTTDGIPMSPVPSLLVWVFTPDLMYSSSVPSPGRQDPTRSIKVFYKEQTWQPLKPGEPESASIDDVELPAQLFEELERGLKASQRVLPPTARSFQGWNVGLLERFDVGEQVAGIAASEADSHKQ